MIDHSMVYVMLDHSTKILVRLCIDYSTTILRLKYLLSARMSYEEIGMLRWGSCWRDLRDLLLQACRNRTCTAAMALAPVSVPADR